MGSLTNLFAFKYIIARGEISRFRWELSKGVRYAVLGEWKLIMEVRYEVQPW